MVPPGAVDVQVAAAHALFVEAEFFYHASARVVLRADARLDPVQPDYEETVIDGHGQRRGGHPAAREPFVDPIPDLPRPGRAPQNAADRQLAGELPTVDDGPRKGLALPGFPAHGPGHGHVRADAGAIQRGLRVRWLPGPQPVRITHSGVAP